MFVFKRLMDNRPGPLFMVVYRVFDNANHCFIRVYSHIDNAIFASPKRAIAITMQFNAIKFTLLRKYALMIWSVEPTN